MSEGRQCYCGDCEYCDAVEELAGELLRVTLDIPRFCPSCKRQVLLREAYPNATPSTRIDMTKLDCCGRAMIPYDPEEVN
jgi:hypothetical protein